MGPADAGHAVPLQFPDILTTSPDSPSLPLQCPEGANIYFQPSALQFYLQKVRPSPLGDCRGGGKLRSAIVRNFPQFRNFSQFPAIFRNFPQFFRNFSHFPIF